MNNSITRFSIIHKLIFFVSSIFVISCHASKRQISVKHLNLEEDIFFHILEPESLNYFYRVRKARDFGAKFNFTFHNVALVMVEPAKACQPITNVMDVEGNVALVTRGDCSFLEKTKHVEAAGALAIIIADNNEAEDAHVVDMIHDGTDRSVHIPAAFMLGKSGIMIRSKLKELGMSRALIDIPVNATSIANVHVRQPPWALW